MEFAPDEPPEPTRQPDDEHESALGDTTPEDTAPEGSTLEDAVPVEVPEELSVLPPGPLLCEILDDLPVQSVSGYDCVEVMAAAYRQLCRQQAVFFEALLETGLRAAGSASAVARLSAPGEFGYEEARAKLVWSKQRSQTTYVLAFDLFVRFPTLGAAMRRAELDLPRARAFIDWTEGLTETQTAQVIDKLLPEAPGMVVGALIDQIKRVCLAIDPEWAVKKYKAAVKAREVRGYRNPDGTATLVGHRQPVDRVAAACDRIDQLARACKRAGDKRTIDLIRSDLYLRMLDGSFEAMTDTEIIAYVLAQPLDDHTDRPDSTEDHHDDPADIDIDDDGSDDGGSGDRSGGDSDDDGGDPGSADGGDNGPDSRSSDGDGSGNDRSNGHDPRGHGPADPGANSDGPGSDDRDNRRASTGAKAVPELRVQLTTLLGENEHPAQLPGWDYVPAWLARHLVATMSSALWRWVVCDNDGHAIDGGITRTRPQASGPGNSEPRDHRRGGILELAVSKSDLRRLQRGPTARGPWASVVTDIARQHARGQPDKHGHNSIGQSRPALRSPAPRSMDTDARDAGRRTPSARLRRWIELRDRVCAHPTCRAPAASTDIDHRIRWSDGGLTVTTNLWPLCRRDHRVKDEGHWTVRQPAPGVIVWLSPLGHEAISRPPPVIPAPIEVQPREDDQTWSGEETPWPDLCACLIRPCPHARAEAVSVDGDGLEINESDRTKPNIQEPPNGSDSPPDPAIYDDDPPPF